MANMKLKGVLSPKNFIVCENLEYSPHSDYFCTVCSGTQISQKCEMAMIMCISDLKGFIFSNLKRFYKYVPNLLCFFIVILNQLKYIKNMFFCQNHIAGCHSNSIHICHANCRIFLCKWLYFIAKYTISAKLIKCNCSKHCQTTWN